MKHFLSRDRDASASSGAAGAAAGGGAGAAGGGGNGGGAGQRMNIAQQNKSSFLFAFLTVLSRIFGLLRVSFISAYFGSGSSADILNLVLTVPSSLRRIFAEGSLSNAYMSVIGRTVHNSPARTEQSQLFLSELLFYVGTVTLLLTLLMSLFSRSIVSFLFEWDSPEEVNTATQLFSVLIFFLFFITLSVVFSGFMQSHKRFARVALSPICHSLSVIGCILLFHNTLQIYSVAVGFVFGSFLQVLLLAVSLIFLGYTVFPRPQILPSPEMRLVLRRYLPSVLTIMVSVASQMVVFSLSSTLSVGSSSQLSYAIVFWQLPIGIIINSINAVAFVYLVNAREAKKRADFVACVQNTVQNLCIFVVPVAILFYLFAHAGIALTLQYGKLTADAAYLVSRILQGYALGLPLLALYLFFQKLMYSLYRQGLVLFYTLFFCTVDLLLTLVLIRTDLGIVGAAYAYSAALAIVLPFMYLNVSRYISLQQFFRIITKVGVGSLPLLSVGYLVSMYTAQVWFEGATLLNILYLLGIALLSAALLLLGYRLVGINVFALLKKKR